MTGTKFRKQSFLTTVAVILVCFLVSTGAAEQNSYDLAAKQNDVEHWLTELKNRLASEKENKDSFQSGPQASVKKGNQIPGIATGDTVSTGTNSVPKISVDFYKIDLHNVFRLLGQVSGKNIVVDESVKGTLTLALQDVPWTFVLDVIKNLKGLSSLERFNTIMIYPSDKEVTWEGREDLSTGTLELEPHTPIITPEPGLTKDSGLLIEGNNGIEAPIEKIIEAQKSINKAVKAEKSGDLSRALELYKKAADEWPTNTSLAKKVASMGLGAQDDELTALNYGKKALRVNPEDSEAATLVAVALARMGKTADARIYFERAMDTEVIPYQTLYNYAVFSFSQNAFRECLRLINRIETTYPLSPEVMLLKARTLERMNNFKEAAREYEAVLKSGQRIPLGDKRFAKERLKILREAE